MQKIYIRRDEQKRVLQEESKEKHKKNLQAIEQFIQTQAIAALDFDDKLVKQFVDTIPVLGETIDVTFNMVTCVRIAG